MEQIDSLQTDLWLCFYEPLRDAALLKGYAKLLSAAELRQQRRFYFERDRHRYLVTRALVRTVLSKYAPIAPEHWHFATNPYGRPEVANEDGAARRIAFNLSHSDGVIVLAVTRDRPVGVDVENVCVQRAATEIADRFFAPEEVAALRALPAAEHRQRFFEYWTLKESYIKARGMGLSIPLDRFAFHLDDAAGMRLSLDPVLADRSERWAFWQFAPAPQYLVAVCVAHSGGSAGAMTVYRAIPRRHEETIGEPMELLATVRSTVQSARG